MTSVPSLRTTVTDLGTWLPVRRCSNAIAASAICCAMVDLILSILVLLSGCSRFALTSKKSGVVEHPDEVFDHVRQLVNEPPVWPVALRPVFRRLNSTSTSSRSGPQVHRWSATRSDRTARGLSYG